jgi:BCD family chlorophyll transporter-like MFS transporter
MLSILTGFLRALRLATPKIGVGWMFALLTIDFNRVSIVELGVAAVLVTTMLSMHYFLSPFQVIVGRLADTHPILGYRRTPYMAIGAVAASVVFMLLPTVAENMGAGSIPWTILGFILFAVFGFGLFAVFGIAMAFLGDCYHSLIAEVTTEKTRGGVISVVWIVTILSTIFAAVVMNAVRPEYTPEAMQTLYNLTPLIVLGSLVIGVAGVEKRLTAEEIEESRNRAATVALEGNPLKAAARLLQENPQTRGFFVFIFLAIFAIFLQDNILEVFGAEVFGMGVADTTKFQPTWGGGVLLGMVVMGIVSVTTNLSKKSIALTGCLGIAVGLVALAGASMLEQSAWVRPILFGMGIFTGCFNVGGLAMMMDMTVEGATGMYMGLWGVAQAFGTGLSSIGSGVLHSGLIESGVVTPQVAYGGIFFFEGMAMLVAAAVLTRISVQQFRERHGPDLTQRDLARAMEAGSVA